MRSSNWEGESAVLFGPIKPVGSIWVEGAGSTTGVAGTPEVGVAAQLDGWASEPERSATLARMRNAWQLRSELSG